MTPQDPSTLRWVKSSHSTNNGTCVEVASAMPSTVPSVLIRDSKDVSGPVLSVSPAGWSSFVKDLHADRF